MRLPRPCPAAPWSPAGVAAEADRRSTVGAASPTLTLPPLVSIGSAAYSAAAAAGGGGGGERGAGQTAALGSALAAGVEGLLSSLSRLPHVRRRKLS
jgi:hypothetical protein